MLMLWIDMLHNRIVNIMRKASQKLESNEIAIEKSKIKIKFVTINSV